MADPIFTIAQRLKPTFARIGGISEADADLSSVCSSVEIAGPGCVDRVTINKTTTGCEVIYDATLTANWVITGMNLVLGKVFNKIGDTATGDLREVLA